jgi:hypothetical protein
MEIAVNIKILRITESTCTGTSWTTPVKEKGAEKSNLSNWCNVSYSMHGIRQAILIYTADVQYKSITEGYVLICRSASIYNNTYAGADPGFQAMGGRT